MFQMTKRIPLSISMFTYFLDYIRYVEGLAHLPGEILLQTIPSVQYFSPMNVISAPASLYLSNFQFVYFPIDSIHLIMLLT